jgi:Flp pilus assembly protein TadB
VWCLLFALFVSKDRANTNKANKKHHTKHHNDEPQDRAKTNKANKKHHTKHYNDEPQDRAKTNKANNKHHTKSVLCGVFCLLYLSSLYLVWPIIVVFCVLFIVCFVCLRSILCGPSL